MGPQHHEGVRHDDRPGRVRREGARGAQPSARRGDSSAPTLREMSPCTTALLLPAAALQNGSAEEREEAARVARSGR